MFFHFGSLSLLFRKRLPAQTPARKGKKTFQLVTRNFPVVIPWIPFTHRWWLQSCTSPEHQLLLNRSGDSTPLLVFFLHADIGGKFEGCVWTYKGGWKWSELVEATGYSDVCKWDEWWAAASTGFNTVACLLSKKKSQWLDLLLSSLPKNNIHDLINYKSILCQHNKLHLNFLTDSVYLYYILFAVLTFELTEAEVLQHLVHQLYSMTIRHGIHNTR